MLVLICVHANNALEFNEFEYSDNKKYFMMNWDKLGEELIKDPYLLSDMIIEIRNMVKELSYDSKPLKNDELIKSKISEENYLLYYLSNKNVVNIIEYLLYNKDMLHLTSQELYACNTCREDFTNMVIHDIVIKTIGLVAVKKLSEIQSNNGDTVVLLNLNHFNIPEKLDAINTSMKDIKLVNTLKIIEISINSDLSEDSKDDDNEELVEYFENLEFNPDYQKYENMISKLTVSDKSNILKEIKQYFNKFQINDGYEDVISDENHQNKANTNVNVNQSNKIIQNIFNQIQNNLARLVFQRGVYQLIRIFNTFSIS